MLRRCRDFVRMIYLHGVRKKNRNHDFTIISQNCIGGVIYNNLGMEFKSPTINMFIEGENFVKLVENLDYYLSLPARALDDHFMDPIDNNIVYPKIAVGDLELCCLHYKNCDEAICAWERRKKRINKHNIYVIGNTWNMHNDNELVRRLINNSPYKTIVFSTKESYCEGTYMLPGNIWKIDRRGVVRPNMTDYVKWGFKRQFETFFDYITWLNEDYIA